MDSIVERRQQLEDALGGLRALIANRDTPEVLFQTWFEQNPVVFTALGYKDFRASPKLPLQGSESLIPDFIVQKLDGTWEISRAQTCCVEAPEVANKTSNALRGDSGLS